MRRAPRSKPLVTSAAAIVIAVLAACGGAGSPPTATPTSSVRPTTVAASTTPVASRTPLLTPAASRTARPAPPTPTKPPATPDPRFKGLPRCTGGDACYIYVVKRGDTLRRIAARFGTTQPAILESNPDVKDANSIKIGQQLRIPAP